MLMPALRYSRLRTPSIRGWFTHMWELQEGAPTTTQQDPYFPNTQKPNGFPCFSVGVQGLGFRGLGFKA